MECFNLSRWSRLCAAAGVPGSPSLSFDDLRARYAEPQRHYHDARHIDESLRELDRAHGQAGNPLALELAIWFHDAVYDPHASDNEERSATLARERLKGQSELQDLVAHLVLATKHHLPGAQADAALLIDIDLAILGKSPERFAEYEAGIRAEYSWVPLDVYREKRAALLRGFLERERVFATPFFHDCYELQARRNLAKSITQLEQP
jgi:predicted metal-dependent HD superfamily phosphohydrolase